MLTTAKVCEQFNPTLVRAIVRKIGRDSLRNVANHGADSGFPGFTYYSDTIAFFKKHRAAIVDMVTSAADDLGENPIEMVSSFNCLGGRSYNHNEAGRRKVAAAAREYYPSISRCLYGGRLTQDDTQVANALAWFALEEVASAFQDD